MRVMVIVKATEQSEAGVMPSTVIAAHSAALRACPVPRYGGRLSRNPGVLR